MAFPLSQKKHSNVFVLAAVLMVVFIVYMPSLRNGFVNWDDPIHLLDNLTIKGLDAEHLQAMFNQRVNKIYIPLTSLSFALEYKFFEYNPFVYHLTNLILHLGVTALVFLLGCRLGTGTAGAAFAALIFGIHPMHVESVAWVTERKDVLYAFFYLLSLHQYLVYLEHKKGGPLVLSLVFGVLSMLAKPMALSLPLIMFLLDWFKGRSINRASVVEKIPLTVIVAAIGWITYSVHARVPAQDFLSAGLTWVWTFVFYLRQFFFPANLIPLYSLSRPVSLANPEFIFSLLIFILLLILVYRLRKHRWFVFACVFYFCSIFFILRFDDMRDTNIVADRFMYLPSLGFCWLAGSILDRFFRSVKTSSSIKNAAALVVALLIAGSAVKTVSQIKVWKDSFTLWWHELKFEPNQPVALNDLATAYRDEKTYKDSIKKYLLYLELRRQGVDRPEVLSYVNAMSGKIDELKSMYYRAVALDPHFVHPVYNLGNLYNELGDTEEALKQYEHAIEVDPDFKDTYFSIGNLYRDKGEAQKAVQAYSKAILLDPDNTGVNINVVKVYNEALKKDPKNEAYARARMSIMESFTDKAFSGKGDPKDFFSLGVLYGEMGDFDQAIRAYRKAIELKPNYASVYYNLGNLYESMGQETDAIESYEQALKINPHLADAYMNWGNILARLGKTEEAIEKYQLAIRANPHYANPYFNLAFLYGSLGQNEKAIEYYRKTLELNPNQSEAYYNLGNIFAARGDNPQAIQSYQRAVTLNSSYMDAFINLALVYYRLKEYEAALKYFDEARVLGYTPPQKLQQAMEAHRK